MRDVVRVNPRQCPPAFVVVSSRQKTRTGLLSCREGERKHAPNGDHPHPGVVRENRE